MVNLRFNVKNVSRTEKEINQVFSKMINQVLQDGGKLILSTIVKNAKRRKLGRVYNGITASTPQESSAYRSGKKTKYTKYIANSMGLVVGVEREVYYAKFIEFGTKKMKPRKDLQKAVVSQIPKITGLITSYSQDRNIKKFSN